MGTCTEFRHFGYAQCIATLNYRVRVASRREAVGAASPRVVLGIAKEIFIFALSILSRKLLGTEVDK
ncbi:MAG: hypothetical protein V7K50_07925 [Nostoc sp.]|uniref:hypothetical protein n=1 Tax=Nostoc sp. TaxID=1180 RepID=UPI002FF47DD0